MNILYLSSVRIPSEKASGLAIVRQCGGFVENGHRVDLLVPVRDDNARKSIQEVYGIEPKFSIKEMSLPSIYNFGKPGFIIMMIRDGIKMFRYFLKNKKQIDLIYTRDHRILLPFILFGYSQKCFLELHTKHTDFITKFVIKRVKKLIVISQGLRSFYESLGRHGIQVEPSGVDLEQFQNLPPVSEIKAKLKLPSDKCIFGYVGKYKTMGESKGVEEIIQTFAAAYQKNKNIFLFLVGVEKDEYDEVLGLFASLDLPKETFAISELDQSLFALSLVASDVLLMNYPNTEHYAKYMSPTKLFAYLAAGKPIITSDLPSVREVEDMRGVSYVHPDSVLEYSEQMLSVVTTLKELNLDTQNNISSVQKFSWSERAKRIIPSSSD